MSDVENLKRAVNTARSAHDELLASARRGEHVAPSMLGQAVANSPPPKLR